MNNMENNCFYLEDEDFYTMAELFCASTFFEQQLGLLHWSIIDSDTFLEPTYLLFADGSEAAWNDLEWQPI